MPPAGHNKLGFTAARIDKLFVHDDQVVPFARAAFENYTGTQAKGDVERLRSAPGWQGQLLRPVAAIIPLHHKIRIPYSTARLAAGELELCLDAVIQTLRQVAPQDPSVTYLLRLPGSMEWDIQLVCATDYRAEILADVQFCDPRGKASILARNSPRFVWRVSMRTTSGLLFDALLDATDFERGHLVFDVIHRQSASVEIFKLTLNFIRHLWLQSVPLTPPRMALAILEKGIR